MMISKIFKFNQLINMEYGLYKNYYCIWYSNKYYDTEFEEINNWSNKYIHYITKANIQGYIEQQATVTS